MTAKNKKRHDFSFISDFIRGNKLKIILLMSVVFISLLTGIIVGAKTGGSTCDAIEHDLFSFGSSFWGRLFSMFLVSAICFGCSFTKFLSPIAILFMSYRGYLLGLNISLIIACNGLAGIVFALLVILPCQLIVLALLVLLYTTLCKMRKDCSGAGGESIRQRLIVFLLVIATLACVCIIESLLSALFSPNIILVV